MRGASRTASVSPTGISVTDTIGSSSCEAGTIGIAIDCVQDLSRESYIASSP